MGFSVSSELQPQKLGALREGDVFVAHVGPTGRLFGMVGGDDTHRLLIVLGSKETQLDDLQVGWFEPDFAANDLAYKIEGASVEIVRNEWGYAEVLDTPVNGCRVLDASGSGWIYTQADKSTVSFNLATGHSGRPASPRRYYANWRIVWTPAGGSEPVVLHHHRGSVSAD